MIYPELTLNLDVLLSGHGNFQKGSACTSPKNASAILGEAQGGNSSARVSVAALGVILLYWEKSFFPNGC